MDKICTYLFFLHDRRSPPHTPHLRSGYNSMRAASSQIPKIHLNRNSQILKLPLVGQWVCDKSRDMNLFTTTPHPPYLFYGLLGLLGLIVSSRIYMSTEERSKGKINNGQNMY